MAAVSGLSPGVALWKVGQRSFVVEHLVSRAERWIVDTEPQEQATHLGRQYRWPVGETCQ